MFYYLQEKENSSLEACLDKENYNENDLITFKIPLSNPYQVSWKDFERVDGEITIRGAIYKYVKRKISDGQLILLCLPNFKKMKLVKAVAEFGSHTNDLNTPGKKNGNALSEKSGLPNEYEENTRWVTNAPFTLSSKEQYATVTAPCLSNGWTDYAGKPPKTA